MSAPYFLGTVALGLLLTLVLEGAVMLPRLLKKKGGTHWAAFVLVNVATNVSLNVILLFVYAAGVSLDGTSGLTFSFCFIALLLEIFVVQAEYFVLKKFIAGGGLFWYVLSANALSCIVGTLVLYLLSSV